MVLENMMYCPNSYFTNDSCTHIYSLVQMVECFPPRQLVHQYSKYIYTFVGTDRFVNNNPSFSTHTVVQIVLDNTDRQLWNKKPMNSVLQTVCNMFYLNRFFNDNSSTHSLVQVVKCWFFQSYFTNNPSSSIHSLAQIL